MDFIRDGVHPRMRIFESNTQLGSVENKICCHDHITGGQPPSWQLHYPCHRSMYSSLVRNAVQGRCQVSQILLVFAISLTKRMLLEEERSLRLDI